MKKILILFCLFITLQSLEALKDGTVITPSTGTEERKQLGTKHLKPVLNLLPMKDSDNRFYYFQNICVYPDFLDKSPEELHFEDTFGISQNSVPLDPNKDIVNTILDENEFRERWNGSLINSKEDSESKDINEDDNEKEPIKPGSKLSLQDDKTPFEPNPDELNNPGNKPRSEDETSSWYSKYINIKTGIGVIIAIGIGAFLIKKASTTKKTTKTKKKSIPIVSSASSNLHIK